MNKTVFKEHFPSGYKEKLNHQLEYMMILWSFMVPIKNKKDFNGIENLMKHKLL